MKSYRKELFFNLPTRRGLRNITREVQAAIDESGVREGLCLVNACLLYTSGRCLYENASRQADLWMAERDDRTILRGGQGEPRPALCAHAWDTEHAGTVFPDSSCAKYQEAGGLFLSRFSSLSIILPLRLCLNAGVCQWSGLFPYGEKLSWRTRRLARYRRNVPVCLLCCAPKAAFFVKEQ